MDLELDPDQLELRDAARTFLATACPPSLVREAFEGDADGVADALWSQMAALGWPSLGIDEQFGGLGQGFVAEAVLVSELGRVVAPSPYLCTVTELAPLLAETIAGEGAGPGRSLATHLLPSLADGSEVGTVALAEPGRHRTVDIRCTATPSQRGWILDGTKLETDPRGWRDATGIVIARLPGTEGRSGVGAFCVGNWTANETWPAIDPTMGQSTLRLRQTPIDGDQMLLDPNDPASFNAIERVRLRATVAMAVSCVATCRAIFEQTVDYAKVRHQFGRPIGSFQAVKHRLADLYLAVERADALAWFAVGCVAEGDERLPIAASMAKAAAGDCQRLATRDGLQLHGGIGFTWEHDLHFWLKRAITTSMLCGSAESHRADLARLLGLAA